MASSACKEGTKVASPTGKGWVGKVASPAGREVGKVANLLHTGKEPSETEAVAAVASPRGGGGKRGNLPPNLRSDTP